MSAGFSLSEPYGLGRAFQQVVRGVSPAAGAVFSLPMDPNYKSRLLGCVFTLTTDANVANRYATVEAEDSDGNPFSVNAAGVVVTANTTQRFVGSMFRGEGEWAGNTDVLFPLAPIFLEGGIVLKINVANVQAGDTLTAIKLVFDRFPTNPQDF